ncbi:MAG: ATP-dependent DNA helicase RecG [Bacteroidales bacterium]|nr:ATP-dependent DNA helicase RecG [Bacteroidales bacterium]
MGELMSDIQFLPGVGPKRAALLKSELEVHTFGELIHFYPFRYIDRGSYQKIAEIEADAAYVQIIAKILKVTLYGPSSSVFYQAGLSGVEKNSFPVDSKGQQAIRFNAVKRMSVIVSDGTGEMEMVFFKGVKWNFTKMVPGQSFLFFGKPQAFNGKINIVHPDVDPVPQDAGRQGGSTLTGVYTSTEKLKNGGITAKAMTKMMAAALNAALPEVQETIPDYIMKQMGLVPLRYALKNIHFPQDMNALAKAQHRLKFEELFFLQMSLLKQKFIRSHGARGIVMPKVGDAFNKCYSSLPFDLTGAQKRVIKEIRSDMMSGHQMNRLLQGDVGSGKTMVAVLSSLIAYGNGYQSCIMAPTEVLAQQHYANVKKYLGSTGVECALLTGSSTTAERREIHKGLEDGSIGIIIGTHALIEDNVKFAKLGLAIVDEQHRFGVEQRAKLWAKTTDGVPPHVLVMTATPIPRTLAMTLYGDLDVSVIDELPPGRKPIETIQIGQRKRGGLYSFMKKEIAAGRQVFIVYPLIFESEKLDLQNLEQGYEEVVKAFPLPDYKVAIVHGQQTNEVKNFNMSAFAAGRAHILVSTTVIEVGVDVPNASVMVIESAQRFGLSQLHQLRGRVGRGSEKSYCILVKDDKISKESQKRLDLMCSTENGFVLAEEDMKMRGPGDLEGTQQSGLPVTLSIASLARDGLLLNEARAMAQKVLEADPLLQAPENAQIVAELRKSKYDIKDYSKIS